MRKHTNGRKKISHIFPPKDIESRVGQTSKTEVWKINKTTLWYYPAKNKRYETPLFLIYSLINRPFILDLSPGMSMIEAFVNEGYDVYLLDFGVPGYEDKEITLDDYITTYIHKAVKRSLFHSGAKEVTMIGYCLGGTLATIYAAFRNETIKNLVLFAPPLDFEHSPIPEEWEDAIKNGRVHLDELIDIYGVIPAKYMEWILRLAVSPITYRSYLGLLQKSHDKEYVQKWHLFNHWLKGHIPFAGATLKQLINDIAMDNKLIKNELKINGTPIHLDAITSDLLVVSTTDDEIVPKELVKPIMSQVSSENKTHQHIKGGHVSLAIKGELPDFLNLWLKERDGSSAS
ncbi:alpha/beta fold hydrolase [Bacillus shivajii]|uniref:alpha/beta fold hydrolase n=1 Tax=Bacillus shivajii TaxID=1983719 RepID=UPI001CFB061F|nr:alpha/beta fold hydrolase [Bacillus shivajii]UCZ54937.1 alpha/beta fold hydrolase [Bacillus shivajii]